MSTGLHTYYRQSFYVITSMLLLVLVTVWFQCLCQYYTANFREKYKENNIHFEVKTNCHRKENKIEMVNEKQLKK